MSAPLYEIESITMGGRTETRHAGQQPRQHPAEALCHLLADPPLASLAIGQTSRLDEGDRIYVVRRVR